MGRPLNLAVRIKILEAQLAIERMIERYDGLTDEHVGEIMLEAQNEIDERVEDDKRGASSTSAHLRAQSLASSLRIWRALIDLYRAKLPDSYVDDHDKYDIDRCMWYSCLVLAYWESKM